MKIKHLILTTIAACIMLTGIAQATPDTAANHIVAVVNDQVITQYELNRYTNFAKYMHDHQPNKTRLPINPEQLRKSILKQLIQQDIAVQIAQKQEFEVTDENAKKILQAQVNAAKKQGMDLIKIFNDAGFDHNNILNFYRQQALAAAIPRQIIQQTKIPADILKKIIETNTTISATDYQFDSKQDAATAAKELRAGNPAALPKPFYTYTEKTLLEMPQQFIPELENKASGDVVGPIDTGKDGNGWHVLKVTQYDVAKNAIASAINAEQQRLAAPAIELWQQQIQKNAYIEKRPPYNV